MASGNPVIPHGAVSCREQGIQLAAGIECMQVVRAADMAVADEDLRYGAAAAGPLTHGAAQLRLAVDIDLLKSRALLLQERLGGGAVGAPAGGVERDLRHGG